MQKRIVVGFTLALLLVLSGSLIVACNQPQEKTTAPETGTLDGEALAQERCSVCHGYDRVETAKKTGDEWKVTVERMVGNGASLNSAEQAAVITHLTEAYPK